MIKVDHCVTRRRRITADVKKMEAFMSRLFTQKATVAHLTNEFSCYYYDT